MKVLPGSTFFQATQGLAKQPPSAAERRDALIQAALGAAEQRSAAQRAQQVEPASSADKPRTPARRGSLIDIRV